MKKFLANFSFNRFFQAFFNICGLSLGMLRDITNLNLNWFVIYYVYPMFYVSLFKVKNKVFEFHYQRWNTFVLV